MVMSIVVVLLGLVAMQRLPVAQYPETVPPTPIAGLTVGDVVDRYLADYVGKRETDDGPTWTGHIGGAIRCASPRCAS